MIIIKLMGGLGNQMFQYAAALQAAARNQVLLKVETAAVESDQLRHLELAKFNTDLKFASPGEVQQLLPRNTIAKLLQLILPKEKQTYHRERNYFYDKSTEQIGPNTYMKGYFQSEKYFLTGQQLIRAQFKPRREYTDHLQNLSAELRRHQSVSVHIRRGDYLDPEIRRVHGLLSEEYYKEAISRFREQVPGATFYFFSDDMVWVRNHFQGADFRYASEAISYTALDDFYLMTQCRHNIIANSSFSWWCAWLNESPGKQVVAPAKWFAGLADDTADRIPASWYRLNTTNLFQ